MPGHHTINTGEERKRAAPRSNESAVAQRPAKQHRGELAAADAAVHRPEAATDLVEEAAAAAAVPEPAAAPATTPRHLFCWWEASQQLTRAAPCVAAVLAGPMAQLVSAVSCPLTVPPQELLTALHRVLLSEISIEDGLLPMLRAFRPVMVAIVSSCVQAQRELTFDLRRHERLGATLALLTRLMPRPEHILLVLESYYRQAPAPFERLDRGDSSCEEALLDIVQMAWRLLRAGHRGEFNWAPVFVLLRCDSEHVRWYATRCVAMLLGLSAESLGRLCHRSSVSTAAPPSVAHEAEIVAVENAVASAASTVHSRCGVEKDTLEQWVAGLTVIDDIILPTRPKRQQVTSSLPQKVHLRSGFVSTAACRRNLRSVATALAVGKPVMLEGPPGVGKTALLDELAKTCGQFQSMIRIHLDDQLDSKTLLGTYVCADEPGQFKWQPGALTQAVRGGRWIVFEDVHCAPFELLAAIKPLLEDRVLFVPGRGERIRAASGFQLFATQTVHDGAGATSKSSHGGIFANLFTHVPVDPLPAEDVRQILDEQFGADIACCIPIMLETFRLFRANRIGAVLGRSGFSLRDLIKWCRRVQLLCRGQDMPAVKPVEDLPHAVRLIAAREAEDGFCAGWAKPAATRRAVDLIRSVWKIDERYTSAERPQILRTPLVFQIGRYQLDVHEQVTSIQHGISGLQVDDSAAEQYTETTHSLVVLEKVAACAKLGEPCLLVGETGTGKTSSVQHVARAVNRKLVVINLNQQTDASDLVGGFKPVDVAQLARPIVETFEKAFCKTFSRTSNASLLNSLHKALKTNNWKSMLKLMNSTLDSVTTANMSTPKRKKGAARWNKVREQVARFEQQCSGKRSFSFSFVEGALVSAIRAGDWVLLDEINLAPAETLERLAGLLDGDDGSLCLTERGDTEALPRNKQFRLFACMNPPTDAGKKELPAGLRSRFTEVLVPEMTNAEDLRQIVAESLRSCPAAQVQDPKGAVTHIVDFYLQVRQAAARGDLLDGAEARPVYTLRTLTRSLNYTIDMVAEYGLHRSLFDGICMSFLTQLQCKYHATFEQLIKKCLLPGVNLETLRGSQNRGTESDRDGHIFIAFEAQLPRDKKKLSQNQEQSRAKQAKKESTQGFWLEFGDKPIEIPEWFIVVPSVRTNLLNLTRAVLSKHPTLLQGPTSTGKTSMIEYLALRTGHRFMRINNHEHTEMAEYIGGYAADHEGRMVWQEGVLVSALRKGWWLVLDELNLAPSEVLEALNRLLDGNRELFIPETQEIVQPHPHFRLFATQNPPGAYGGRKTLSRAFRNRFLELQVDESSPAELQLILELRSHMPMSFAKRIIDVMKALQQARQGSRLFSGKSGFITPRDLFRWAERRPRNWTELAQHGYMLLAERARKPEERAIVKETIENCMKEAGKIDVAKLYSCKAMPEYAELQANMSSMDTREDSSKATFDATDIVWTQAMQRLFTLLSHCIAHQEPVLLVGGTGIGKTTVCQLFSVALQRQLHIINCHQHTDTADFIGGFRPVREREKITVQLRAATVELLSSFADEYSSETGLESLTECLEAHINAAGEESFDQHQQEILHRVRELQALHKRLFSWADGSLVTAMRGGHLFVIDEISLADDAVLERLNSVLEPGRMLVLAERSEGGVEELKAHDDFRIMATMNPGGDFGKKELSPALRNRFTEIWVSDELDSGDLQMIVDQHYISSGTEGFARRVVQFAEWLSGSSVGVPVPCLKHPFTLSLRDIMTWISFMNTVNASIKTDKVGAKLPESEAYLHGAFLVLLDGLGLGRGMSGASEARTACLAMLEYQGCHVDEFRSDVGDNTESVEQKALPIINDETSFGAYPFVIARGPGVGTPLDKLRYILSGGTYGENTRRVLRAMQLSRPILLEGPPGVGKSSLIEALAKASGHNLVRINLSEQTEISDLMGNDLPVSSGNAGDFAWRDGVFLAALKAGNWVLLDELNLASQAVLEGLNSCLDHRGTVWIPEIGKSFDCPSSFRIFGAQNPLQQGGGRKGLPKSFLNRFTKVYIERFVAEDLERITRSLYPRIDTTTITKMVRFNTTVFSKTSESRQIGRLGYPWDFNLRDILRWAELIEKHFSADAVCAQPGDEEAAKWVDLLYMQRMRTTSDRASIAQVFAHVFDLDLNVDVSPPFSFSEETFTVGRSTLPRKKQVLTCGEVELLQQQMNTVEAVLKAIEMRWLTILVGDSGSGKTSIIRLLAQLSGNDLYEYTISDAADTSEFLGCFEQVDPSKAMQNIIGQLKIAAEECAELLVLVQDEQAIEASRSLLDAAALLQRLGHIDDSLEELEKQHRAQQQASHSSQLLQQIEQTMSRFGIPYDTQSLQATLRNNSSASSNTEAGRFEWVDGKFLEAVEHGGWVVLDNVNLCEPTVLDRLNPLCESGGVLQVNEQGLLNGEVRTIHPHPEFRLFMVMDPGSGEISRAMRNRGLEIFVLQPRVDSRDVVLLMNKMGFAGNAIAARMGCFHEALGTWMASNMRSSLIRKSWSVRDILQWGRLSMIQIQSGVSPLAALRSSMTEVYGHAFKTETARIALSSLFDEHFDANNVEFWRSAIGSAAFCAGVWPHTITTTDYCWDHNSATMNRQGAVYEMLVSKIILMSLSPNPQTTELTSSALCAKLSWHAAAGGAEPLDKTVVAIPKLLQMANVAGKMFVQQASREDWPARKNWLQRTHDRICHGYSMLEVDHMKDQLQFILTELFTGDLHESTRQRLDELLTLLGNMQSSQVATQLSVMKLSSPLDFRVCPTACSLLQRAARVLGQSDLLRRYENVSQMVHLLLWQIIPQQHDENVHLQRADTLQPSQMSLLQLSFCASQNSQYQQKDVIMEKLTEQDGAIELFYPLVEHVRNLVGRFCSDSTSVMNTADVSAFEILLSARQKLFRSLSASKHLDHDGFIVLWKAFTKAHAGLTAALNYDEENRNVNVCIDAINSAMKLRAKFPRTLWKYGGFPRMPRSEALAAVDATLLQLSSRITYNIYCHDANFETEHAHNAMVATQEIKRALSEAVCFLRSLHWISPSDTQLVEAAPFAIPSTTIDQVSEQLMKSPDVLARQVEEVIKHPIPDDAVDMSMMKPLWQMSDHCLLRAELQAMHQISELVPDAIAEDSDSAGMWPIDATAKTSTRRAVQKMTHLVEFALKQTARSCVDTVAHQQFVCLASDTSGAGIARMLPSIFADMMFTWHKNLWTRDTSNPVGDEAMCINDVAMSASDGPGQLYCPLHTVIMAGILENWNDVPIMHQDAKLRQMRSAVTRLCHDTLETYTNDSFARHDRGLFCRVLKITLQCFALKLEPLASEQVACILDCIENSNGSAKEKLGCAADRLQELLQTSAFAKLCTCSLGPVLKWLSSSLPGKEEEDPPAGMWVLLAVWRMRFLLPPYPVDPVVQYQLKLQMIKVELEKIESEISVWQEQESCYRGRSTNQHIEELKQQREELYVRQSIIEEQILPRPVPCQFAQIFQELWDLFENVISKRASQILDKMTADTDGALHTQIEAEERMCQHSISRAIGRLNGQFPLYRDVLQPCLLAAYEVKYGLRSAFIAYNSQHRQTRSVILATTAALLGTVESDPSVLLAERQRDDWSIPSTLLSFSREMSLDSCPGMTADHGVNILETCMQAAASAAYLDGPTANVLGCNISDSIFNHFAEVWGAIEEKAMRKKEEANLEFRIHATDAEPPSVFPDFHGDFVDRDEDQLNDTPDGNEGDKAAFENASLSMVDSTRICDSHRMIYTWLGSREFQASSYEKLSRDMKSAAVASGFQLMTVAAKNGLTSELHTLNNVHAVLFGTAEAVAGLSGTFTDGIEPGKGAASGPNRNVYTDSNVAEVRLVRQPLHDLCARLRELLQRWEDHPILSRMLHLSELVLNLPSQTPVMKVLTGIEILLHKAQEWQMNASREVSLQLLLNPFMTLVERWRRLELEQWRGLLDSKVTEMENHCARYWFFLYRIIHSFEDGTEKETREHIQTMFESIAEFMQRAPIGEYHSRLRLLHQFAQQIKVQCATAAEAGVAVLGRRKLSALLQNVHRYFDQFSTNVKDDMARLRKPVETKLREFVKISKWDKQNYYSLKASSERSHAKLNQFARQFEEALHQPAGTTIMAAERLQAMDDAKKDFIRRSQQPTVHTDFACIGAPISEFLTNHFTVIHGHTGAVASLGIADKQRRQANLERLHKKLVSHFATAVLSQHASEARDTGSSYTEALAAHIITRALSLRESAPMKNMKRKAFADLLKKLKSIGCKAVFAEPLLLSVCLSQDVPGRIDISTGTFAVQTDPRATHRQSLDSQWSRANDYFFRCIFRLQKMRRLSSDFSDELTAVEVGKMSSYVEHLLAVVVDQRGRLNDLNTSVGSLRFVITQLDATSSALHTSDVALCNPTQQLERLQAQLETFNKMIHYATEKRTILEAFASVGPSPVEEPVSSDWQRCANLISQGKCALEKAVRVWREAKQAGCEILACAEAKQALSSSSEQAEQVREIMRNLQHKESSDRAHGCLHLSEAAGTMLSLSDTAATILSDGSSTVVDEMAALVPMRQESDVFLVEFGNTFEELVDQVLISTQSVCKASAAWHIEASEIEQDDRKAIIAKQMLHFHQMFAAATMPKLIEKLSHCCNLLQTAGDAASESASTAHVVETAGRLLSCIVPMLRDLSEVVDRLLLSFVAFHSSLGKLLFVLLNVFSEIMEKGFCTPPDGEEEDGEGDGDTDDNVAGMGMADGQGNKDVSDQIEDEEQLLGLKGDKEEEQEDDQEQEHGEGKEMENEFEGEMMDKQGQGDQDDDSDEDNNKDDMDREMDETDEKQDEEVDEKMWGDVEDDPEDENKQEDKDEQVDSMQSTGEKTGELEGQDRDGKEKDEAGEEHVDMPDEQEDEARGEHDEQEPNFVDDAKQPDMDLDDDMEIDDNEEGGADEDESAPPEDSNAGEDQTEDIKMPEDETDEKEEKYDEQKKPDGPQHEDDNAPDADENQDGDDDADVDEKDADTQEDADHEDADPSGTDQPRDLEVEDVHEQDENDPDDDDSGDQVGAEEDEADQNNSDPMDEDQNPDETPLDGDTKMGDEQDKEDDDLQEDEDEHAQPTAKRHENFQKQEHTVMDQSGEGDTSVMDTEAEKRDGANEDQQESSEQDTLQAQKDGMQLAGRQSAEGDNSDQANQPEAAPPKSLADAMREWTERAKRLNVVGEAPEVNEEEPQSGQNDRPQSKEDDADAYQFLPENAGDGQEDAVAEAAADAHQDQGMQKEAEEADINADDADESEVVADQDETEATEEEAATLQPSIAKLEAAPESNEEQGDESTGTGDKEDEDEEEESENAAEGIEEAQQEWFDAMDEVTEAEHVKGQANAVSDLTHAADLNDEPLNPLLDEPEDEEAIALEEAERDKLREEVEDALKNWWTAGENSDRVSKERLEQLWREYDRITDGPALELCETLRLVLAPTKASKMKGGYSAGKRINMRAVIPYIASDFKKDKIWLRRTQPDKRNYQILIAIDDSESMREKRSGQLACEAMLVLCKALERLQVGQVGVVRFGEQAELILPFDRPYNAEAGSAMLSKFTFAQENADFEQLLKFTSEVFAQAGSGPDATSGKALQLLFVIGDGQIRKARDSCRTLIRQAAERSQMCAAIMIDTPDDLSQSIMKVQAPNFDPSGKFVGLTPYLDSFPFNFYTVLQDSELLPDVMGDALRQWYEMTTES